MNLTLHLTSLCNMNCSYCYNNADGYKEDMTMELAQKAIDLAINSSPSKIMHITFVGGEPLLKKDLIEQIVEYCNQINQRTFLFSLLTNGLLLDKRFIDFSLTNNIAISLSLDGTKISHDLFRKTGDEGSWERISEKFYLLISKVPDSMILMTLNPETTQYLGDSIRYLFESGARKISISLNYLTQWQHSHLAFLESQIREIAKYYMDCYRNNDPFYINIFDSRMHSFIDGFVNKGRCNSDGNHLSIAPDGEIFPCIAFVYKNSQYKIGDLESGINNTELNEFKNKQKKTNQICQDCVIKDRCFNWCACANYLGTGRIDDISPVLCEFEKILIPVTYLIAEGLYSENNKCFLRYFYTE